MKTRGANIELSSSCTHMSQMVREYRSHVCLEMISGSCHRAPENNPPFSWTTTKKETFSSVLGPQLICRPLRGLF